MLFPFWRSSLNNLRQAVAKPRPRKGHARANGISAECQRLEDRSLLTPTVTIFCTGESSGVSTISELPPQPSASPWQSATFTFGLDEAAPTDLTINWTISGTAINGIDYSGAATSGSVTIPAGTLHGSGTPPILITAVADALVEGDEALIMTVASTASYNGDSRTLTIRDNLAPTVGDDSASVVHDRSITIPISTLLDNDNDPDGHPLTLNLGSPTNGTAVLNGSGGVVFTPIPGFVTTPTDIAKFTYTVTDGAMTSNTATVTVNVTNQTPVAVNDSGFSVLHDRPLSITAAQLLANDTDGDDDPLNFIFISATNGTVNSNDNGTPSDPTDDFLDAFIPTPGYAGLASITYKVNDAIVDSNSVTVIINVTNNAPTATGESTTLTHSTPALVQTWISSTLYGDIDDDLLAVTITALPTKGTAANNGDGMFTYTANINESGADSFTFSVTDSVTGLTPVTATVSISLTNFAPIFADETHGELTLVDRFNGNLGGWCY